MRCLATTTDTVQEDRDINMTIRDTGDLIIWIGAICAAIFAIGAIVHWSIMKPLRAWIVETVAKPVNEVKDEVKSNAGVSMKDTIDRIEIKVDALDKRFSNHITLGHGGRDDTRTSRR